MNLFNAVRPAERAVADGHEKEAVSLLRLADAILDDAPAERNDIVARCCSFRLPDGRVHCGTVRDDGLVEEMLFPGTPEERKALCHTCAVDCAERVEVLRMKLVVTVAT